MLISNPRRPPKCCPPPILVESVSPPLHHVGMDSHSCPFIPAGRVTLSPPTPDAHHHFHSPSRGAAVSKEVKKERGTLAKNQPCFSPPSLLLFADYFPTPPSPPPPPQRDGPAEAAAVLACDGSAALIHRSSFTLWETRGRASNWHRALFVPGR